MKTGSINLNFLCNFSQLLLSNVNLLTVLFTADVGFLLVFWLGICLEVSVDIISTPSRLPLCFCPCHNSLFNTSDRF